MSRKKPGRYVRHQDGREGIAYNEDQIRKFEKQGKVLVRFDDEPERLKAVNTQFLKMIGFVD